MRILVVSPYPPIHDGIGSYTVQQAMNLRAQGHQVEVLSPLPSAAHHHLELRGWRGCLALAQYTPRYDRVIVHFHVDMFYPAPLARSEWALVTLALLRAFQRARQLDLTVHEINYDWGRRRSTRELTRRMLRAATRLQVHTESEKRRLTEAFGLSTGDVEVVEHGSHFVRRTTATRDEARERLGVPLAAHVFLAIGFLQPHKGFDRAVRAFGGLGSRGCRLYIVGSVRVEEPEYVAHLAELRRLADAEEGVELRAEFVSDERFDEWLVASDVVLLPYRYIWSSGVLERARLYDRAVIAADVGGLRDQGHPGVTWFSSDAELAAAMAASAPGAGSSAPVPAFDVPPDAGRDVVMAEIRRRAALQRRPAAPTAAAAPAHRAAAPLLRVGHVAPPNLDSGSWPARTLKRCVHRLVRWQTEPLRQQVNAVRDAALEAVDDLAAAESAMGTEARR